MLAEARHNMQLYDGEHLLWCRPGEVQGGPVSRCVTVCVQAYCVEYQHHAISTPQSHVNLLECVICVPVYASFVFTVVPLYVCVILLHGNCC